MAIAATIVTATAVRADERTVLRIQVIESGGHLHEHPFDSASS
jgi:hypothetical protein